MSAHETETHAAWVLIAVLLLAVFVVWTPYGLGHATSPSMEPALTSNDLYVLAPAVSIDSSDIIVFKRESDGAYISHRVVEVTDSGYITKGDNNQFTDQEAGLSPVDRAQVVGKVPVVFGEPLVFEGVFSDG